VPSIDRQHFLSECMFDMLPPRKDWTGVIRKVRKLALVAAAATTLAAASVAYAGFTKPRSPSVDTAAEGTSIDVTAEYAPAMIDAMRRDLQLDDKQIGRHLRAEAAAASVEQSMRVELGSAYGGAWLDPGAERLTVAVTDSSAAERVRAAGAEPKVVGRGERQLADAKKALDGRAANAGKGIHGWHVDPASNTVVVAAEPGAASAATEFIKTAGVPADAVRIVASTSAPRPAADVQGGEQYGIPTSGGFALCSVGFSVVGGFVTAGHCGQAGANTIGENSAGQGTVRASTFPGKDFAWVQVNGGWTPQPFVNNHANGRVPVAGSREAPVGASVCRSGRTTGWRCGVIAAKNATVNYSNGPVYGLTESTACAEPGDSGGSVISGDQAQGVTSGSTGACSAGGHSFFQPVNEILRTYGLTLTTVGNGGGGGGGGNGGGNGRGGNNFVSGLNGKCIDVPGGEATDGRRLVMWDCHDGANQNWTFHSDGTVRAMGMCMDVAWGSRDNGAVIQLAHCSGNPAQKFVLSAAGDLVNPQANKCVDIASFNNANGAKLVQWECTGQANQKWRRG
jgi:streptogrisin C